MERREKPFNLLGIDHRLPVDDPPLDEDPDLDLERLAGVCGETDGDGGVVVNNVQRTEVHGPLVAVVDDPEISTNSGDRNQPEGELN